MANEIVSTKNVWPYYDAANVQAAAAKPKDTSLGKDDFLKILVEQLKNQNPMEPLQDKDYIAQMAQFSSVEQLMNMAKEMTALRTNLGFASGLIGKEVEWIENNASGQAIERSGTVDSIVVRDGVQYVKIGDENIPVDRLTSIADKREVAAGE